NCDKNALLLFVNVKVGARQSVRRDEEVQRQSRRLPSLAFRLSHCLVGLSWTRRAKPPRGSYPCLILLAKNGGVAGLCYRGWALRGHGARLQRIRMRFSVDEE
ncbi:unnamed protein product, partial [Durusdinium trenchii]